MTKTDNLKGKLARELDAIRARIDLDHMTAGELRLLRGDLFNLAARAYKAERRASRKSNVAGFINAGNIGEAITETSRKINARLDALQAATL